MNDKILRLSAVVLLAVLSVGGQLADAASPEQELYWWQDEIRQVAWELSRLRSGSVSQWPNTTIQAGRAKMPVPLAQDPITVDGSLDEPASLPDQHGAYIRRPDRTRLPVTVTRVVSRRETVSRRGRWRTSWGGRGKNGCTVFPRSGTSAAQKEHTNGDFRTGRAGIRREQPG